MGEKSDESIMKCENVAPAVKFYTLKTFSSSCPYRALAMKPCTIKVLYSDYTTSGKEGRRTSDETAGKG